MAHRRILDELASIIGYQPTARLLRAFGGRRLYIPATLDDEHPITWVVGYTHAQTLTTRYGGERLDLPDEHIIVLDLRNQRMAAEYRRGHSVRQLAKTYGMSPRGIRHILNKLALREAGAEQTEQRPPEHDDEGA